MKRGYFRRRKYWINTRVQLKYMVLTMSMLFLYTLLLLAAIFAPSILAMFTENTLRVKAEVSQILLLLHNQIWPGLGTIIVLFGLYSILVTHKIAGPLFVMERAIKQVAAGDLSSRVRVRGSDELQEFHLSFNKMVDNMEGLLINLDKEYYHLSSYVTELENQLTSRECVSAEFLNDLAGKMSVDKNNIGNILNQYKYRKNI
jgi:methyl-accepting chemotaxis protein